MTQASAVRRDDRVPHGHLFDHRPFVFDHSEQRQSFRELYADVVEACFDDVEQWEREHGIEVGTA